MQINGTITRFLEPNTDTDVIPEFTMSADNTEITSQSVTRTGLGVINYVAVSRNTAAANACGVNELFLHGIIVGYPRQ